MTIFCWKEEALCFCVISVLGLACILDRGPVFVTGGGRLKYQTKHREQVSKK